MEVTVALIEKLAHLSRLNFDEGEKELIRQDLEKMISFVDKLNELNLEGIAPLTHISEEVNVLREDEIKQPLDREEALKNAADHDRDFFRVPKVINK
jgi:aspartyl-tRNA(Asn)/glutamyl-tRNA(Gln) amidotransferase subunit C